jgi:hypothetical protein
MERKPKQFSANQRNFIQSLRRRAGWCATSHAGALSLALSETCGLCSIRLRPCRMAARTDFC